MAEVFRPFDTQTGAVVWQPGLDSPVSGHPVSFAVDGRQYVAMPTGPSLVAAAARRVTPELAPADAAASVYVFALSD